MTAHGDDLDPLAAAVERACATGWVLIPHLGADGACGSALWRSGRLFTDLVTLPLRGESIVARVQGGPVPGQPRRIGYEHWRHRVTPAWAVDWATTNPYTDELLVRWQNEAQG